MENAADILNAYYASYDEDGRLRSKHGFVEFHTTMRYIQKYLKPGDRILEIGAGTGRYSHALAQMGYPVDAVELIGHNIEVFRQNTHPGEQITIRQGNALDLSDDQDNTYDITLLLGPMYHLYTEEDALTALREAVRVTKSGGIVFVAFKGHPLGLAKNIGTRANNLYPKEWRIKSTHIPEKYEAILRHP